MITRRDDQKKSVREYMRGGREFVQLTALSRELPEHARLFSVLRLIPGASIGYHEHEGETEMFYFLEGCGRVRDDDKYFDVIRLLPGGNDQHLVLPESAVERIRPDFNRLAALPRRAHLRAIILRAHPIGQPRGGGQILRPHMRSALANFAKSHISKSPLPL